MYLSISRDALEVSKPNCNNSLSSPYYNGRGLETKRARQGDKP